MTIPTLGEGGCLIIKDVGPVCRESFLGPFRALGLGALPSGYLDVEQEKRMALDPRFGFCPGLGRLGLS